jgi:hypothetical protein
VALVLNLTESQNKRWDLTVEGFPNGPYGTGTMMYLNLDADDKNHIVPSKIRFNRLCSSDIDDFLNLENTPIFYDEELTWNDEFTQLTDRE